MGKKKKRQFLPFEPRLAPQTPLISKPSAEVQEEVKAEAQIKRERKARRRLIEMPAQWLCDLNDIGK